jgi:hypothetical protein
MSSRKQKRELARWETATHQWASDAGRRLAIDLHHGHNVPIRPYTVGLVLWHLWNEQVWGQVPARCSEDTPLAARRGPPRKAIQRPSLASPTGSSPATALPAGSTPTPSAGGNGPRSLASKPISPQAASMFNSTCHFQHLRSDGQGQASPRSPLSPSTTSTALQPCSTTQDLRCYVRHQYRPLLRREQSWNRPAHPSGTLAHPELAGHVFGPALWAVDRGSAVGRSSRVVRLVVTHFWYWSIVYPRIRTSMS